MITHICRERVKKAKNGEQQEKTENRLREYEQSSISRTLIMQFI